jgi:hypothetical protein
LHTEDVAQFVVEDLHGCQWVPLAQHGLESAQASL